MPLTILQAALIGFHLEMILYGAYIVVSISHFTILHARRTWTKAFAYQLFTAVVLFITITIHAGTNLAHATYAYTSSTTEAMNSITEWHTIFNDIGIVTSLVATASADLFLVYRVHVLWASNWRISVLPFLLWLASVILGILGGSSHPDTLPDPSLLYPLLAVLATNFVGTLLISYRIISTQRQMQSFLSPMSTPIPKRMIDMEHPLSKVVVIVIESAFVYLACLIVLMALQVRCPEGSFLIIHFMTPLIGIVFSSIIVRAAANSKDAGDVVNVVGRVADGEAELGRSMGIGSRHMRFRSLATATDIERIEFATEQRDEEAK